MKRLCALLSVTVLAVANLTPPARADIISDPTLSNTTFNNMPAFSDGGTTVLNDPTLTNAVGYNPSRSWSAGSRPENVVMTGDLFRFGVGDATVQKLIGNVDPSQVSLASFSAVNGMSLQDLTTAIPGLANTPVSAVPALRSLAAGAGGNYQQGLYTAASAYIPGAKAFLAANPWASQLPINSLIQGDWNGVLDGGVQVGLSKVVQQYPGLKNVPLGDFASNLIDGNWKGAVGVGVKYGGQLLVKDLLKNNPALGKIPLGELLDTRNLSLNSIPGLTQTALKKFPGIANQPIAAIPGLGNISLKDLLSLGDLLRIGFAQVDIPFGSDKEGKAPYTISGSTKDDNFMPEPCVGKCPNFELANAKNIFGLDLKGRQWVTKVQKVPGGKGFLGKVNGGKEPTGLTPWGPKPNMKLVVESINEQKGTAAMSLYLRFCIKTRWVDLGCIPYVIGPIPAGTVNEKGNVLIATSAPPPRIQSSQGSGSTVCDPVVAEDKKKSLYGYTAYPAANESDLTSVPTNMNRTEVLNKDAAAAFNKMKSDAASQGIDLSVISGYRSVATQTELWNAQVAKQGSEPAAAKISAPPGYSEHQTGYAFDIGQTGAGGSDLNQSFQNTPAYQWLHQNAGKYGFVQSYNGSTSGADNEPWHWRFEGTQAAKSTFSPTSTSQSSSSGNCSNNSTASSDGSNDCSVYKGVSVGAFKDAIADIESQGSGGYSAVGPMIPPTRTDPTYAVGLGKYQFMSFRPEVIASANARGGSAWLQSIANGRTPTAAEVNQYFPPDVQETVMTKETGILIDQAQQKGAKSIGLVETAAMIHNGGINFDPNKSWTKGGLTVGEYAGKVVDKYNKSVKGVDQKCSQSQPSPGNGKSGSATGKFKNPVPGATVGEGWLTRDDPNNHRGRPHKGIDLAIEEGTNIGAADGGVIAHTGFDEKYGNFVIVDHGNGLATLYAHMSNISATTGQSVSQGQSIGKVGHTGRASGPHLHLEIIEDYQTGDIYSGHQVDPQKYFKL
jgi:LAS superfamily LD-carboxypeptidase LdcB/murein DD-endopeptidase MepM/ murein hydrolase activator NlpD